MHCAMLVFVFLSLYVADSLRTESEQSLRMAAVEELVLRLFRSESDVSGEYSTCFTRASKPTLTIVSLVAGLPADYVAALRENRALEGDAYGYEYCEYNHSLEDSRDVAWSKVVAIRELLKQNKSTLVWMDGDAFFTTRKPFEEFTKPYFDAGKEMVFTDDLPGGSKVNSGVVAMRNTEWTKSFWKHIWEDYPEALQDSLWEQKAIDLHMERHKEVLPHIQIIEHKKMNSVGRDWGPFIAHKAGGHVSDKYQKLLPRVREANKAMKSGRI